MSFLTGILGKIVGAVIPTVGKEKAKISSVDSMISKKNDASKAEIVMALGYKYLRLIMVGAMLYAIVSGKVSVGEVLKAISTVTAIGF